MKNINEYIIEKLIIDKNVVTPKMKKEIGEENILCAENAQGLPSVITETIGYDDDIIYETIEEWLKDNDIENVVLFVGNKDYHLMENSGCPDYCLNRFVVNDDIINELYDKHYFEAKTKVATNDISYVVKTTPELLFFSSDTVEHIIMSKYNK